MGAPCTRLLNNMEQVACNMSDGMPSARDGIVTSHMCSVYNDPMVQNASGTSIGLRFFQQHPMTTWPEATLLMPSSFKYHKECLHSEPASHTLQDVSSGEAIHHEL